MEFFCRLFNIIEIKFPLVLKIYVHYVIDFLELFDVYVTYILGYSWFGQLLHFFSFVHYDIQSATRQAQGDAVSSLSRVCNETWLSKHHHGIFHPLAVTLALASVPTEEEKKKMIERQYSTSGFQNVTL